MRDPYCYPGTDVLMNKYDIHDADSLFNVERRISLAKAMLLQKQPMQGNFDLNHLRAIHRFLFSDIYDWAGEIRTVDIGKGNVFCHAAYIEKEANRLFDELRHEHYLNDIDELASFAKRIAYYLSEINAIHPFREGNGRAQRIFVQHLSYYNGFRLRFDKITKEEMLAASQASFLCEYEPMEKIILRGISKAEIE